jgi:hypothetical protein
MLFFRDVHGTLYPVSRIRRVEPTKMDPKSGWRPPASVDLNDGPCIRVDMSEIDRITTGGEPVFPAMPGFDHLTFWYHPENPEATAWTSALPVIGWRDSAEDGITAVTIDDNAGVRAPTAIRLPNGEVTNYSERWDTQAIWEADMKEAADAEHTRARAIAEAKGTGDGRPVH